MCLEVFVRLTKPTHFFLNSISLQLSNSNGFQINCLKLLLQRHYSTWIKKRKPIEKQNMLNLSHNMYLCKNISWLAKCCCCYFLCSSIFFFFQKKKHPIIGLTTCIYYTLRFCYCCCCFCWFFFFFDRTGFSVLVEWISHARVYNVICQTYLCIKNAQTHKKMIRSVFECCCLFVFQLFFAFWLLGF